MRVEIYIGERYYGSIRLRRRSYIHTEEEIVEEIKKRLPLLENKKFTVAL